MNRSVKNEETFGKRLERLRKNLGLTAKAVASHIGVPESTYREWEYGRSPKLPPLQEMARLFGVSVTELLTGEKLELATIAERLAEIEEGLRQLRHDVQSRI